MKKITIVIFVLCTITFSPLFADNEEDQIRHLLELSGSGDIGVMVIESMVMQFQTLFPEIPKEYWSIFQEETTADELINLVVPIYQTYFTTQDIGGLIEFYESPLGQKLSASQPMITQDSMLAGQAWGAEVAHRILKRMENDGYYTE